MASSSSAPNPVFMRRAIAEAMAYLPALAEGPFGACLVKDEEIVAVAYNTVLQNCDPTCHAEINAIRLAAGKLKTYDFFGCELCSTTEPCPMCFAAIHWARIARLIYGTTIDEAASLGFNELTICIQDLKTFGNSPLVIYPDFLVEDCRQLLHAWEKIPGRQVY